MTTMTETRIANFTATPNCIKVMWNRCFIPCSLFRYNIPCRYIRRSLLASLPAFSPFIANRRHSSMISEKPLVVIMGTTGVGKSDLAIALAEKFNGEVINGDSMQVYKGLDIIVNKVTEVEKRGVPHHIMDILEPHKTYSVTEFFDDSTKIINQLHSEDKLPIVVGGTHYYLQYLLWGNDFPETNTSDSPSVVESLNLPTSPEELYNILKSVDPKMAERWHPNDERKVRRSLEIYYTTGKRHSDILQTQEVSPLQSLRYRTLIYWIHSDQKSLDPRLDGRVDKMIQRGLFDELLSLRAYFATRAGSESSHENETIFSTSNQQESDSDTDSISSHDAGDYTKGIQQAIGYKEFDPYFRVLAISPESGNSQFVLSVTLTPQLIKSCLFADHSSILDSCILQMKQRTRRYARKQVSWIRNKLMNKIHRTVNDEFTDPLSTQNDCSSHYPSSPRVVKGSDYLQMFVLDASDISKWRETVLSPATSITEKFIGHQPLPNPTSVHSNATELLKPSSPSYVDFVFEIPILFPSTP
ncbi:IPP transferase-domain-containing protein [Paraphysoderma sedebokerense]|nr:IPP transferase-domain-containing protein [Paraphysoderma sedebokerense]